MTHRIEIIAHRGVAAAPENTLPSHQLALDIGVDYIDVDVVLTADKNLLAYHDLIINPNILCSKSGHYLATSQVAMLDHLDDYSLDEIVIKNLTLKYIKENYLVKLNPQSPYYRWFPQQQNYPATPLASLQEVVDLVNKCGNNRVQIQIELKNESEFLEWCNPPEEWAQIIYKFIIANDLIERVKIQSFDWRILMLLNYMDKRIKTAYLVHHHQHNIFLKWLFDIKTTAIYNLEKNNSNILYLDMLEKINQCQLDLLQSLANKSATEYKVLINLAIIKFIKAFSGYSYEPEDAELTHEYLKTAHSLGLKVYVWHYPQRSGNIYDAKLVHKLIMWKVDGITTDKPDLLRQQLLELGYTVPKL